MRARRSVTPFVFLPALVLGSRTVFPPERFEAATSGSNGLRLSWIYAPPFVREVSEYHVHCTAGGETVYWERCIAAGQGVDGPCFGELVELEIKDLQPGTWHTCRLDIIGIEGLESLYGFGNARALTAEQVQNPEGNDVSGGKFGTNPARETPALEQTPNQGSAGGSASEKCSPDVSLRGAVSITEVMSSNEKSLSDEDGDFPDWIEILVQPEQGWREYVCLSGWSLVDKSEDGSSKDDAEKSFWNFPDIPMKISSSSRLVVFASGKDRRDPRRELHTNFAISSSGEALTLLFQGQVEESIYIPPLKQDKTYGIVEDMYQEEVSASLQDPIPRRWSILQVPTPGKINSGADESLGPVVMRITNSADVPMEGTDLVIKAEVDAGPGETQVAKVTLRYMVGYGRLSELKMTKTGSVSSGAIRETESAGVESYEGRIPSSAFGKGDMVRWSVVVQDGDGKQSVFPPFRGEDQPKMYGTVVADPTILTKIPILHWFVEDESKVDTREGSRCSLMFLGRFYDNVFCRSRGVTSATWPKKKYKFNFPGKTFVFSEQQEKVDDANWDSMYDELGEESYMRYTLASAFFQKVGVPAPLSFHVHVRQNGEFHGLYNFVEQPDTTFLERNNLDPGGSFYKALGTRSNLRTGIEDSNLQYHYEKVTKTSEEEYDWSDLASLIDALSKWDVEAFLYDNINLPQVINELAAQAAILNQDRCTKNYLLLRDSKTNEWMRLPWDLDGTFSIGSGYGGEEPSDGYCVLTCEQFNSPLYCDRDHPQDIPPASSDSTGGWLPGFWWAADVETAAVEGGLVDWEENYNHLTDALLGTPSIREMYLRRLRTIMDTVLDTNFLVDKASYFREMIEYDAELDNKKWGAGELEEGFKQLVEEQIPRRKDTLFKEYGPEGSGLIPEKQTQGLTLELRSVVAKAWGISELQTYLQFYNPNLEALDISGWKLAGGVSFDFAPGTVVPSKESIFVSPDVLQFRKRSSGPRGGQSRFVVGPLVGSISEGQQITLQDQRGDVMSRFTA